MKYTYIITKKIIECGGACAGPATTKYIWNGIGKGKYKVDFQVWVGEVVK